MNNITLNLSNNDMINIQLTCDVSSDNHNPMKIEVFHNGTISSTLHIAQKDPTISRWMKTKYNSMIDALESLILAHACAGVNVESREYIAGIETALDAINNNVL